MFSVLSKWEHPAETFSLVLVIISVAKEFTEGRETFVNIIRLCYSRTERERERHTHKQKSKKTKICRWKSEVKEVHIYMFRGVGVSEQS
jgi:hypothetical protein